MEQIHVKESTLLDHPTGMALGNFDGIHRGHQYLFQTLMAACHQRQWKTSVLLFDVHSKTFLSQQPLRLLTDLDDKVELLQAFHFDYIYHLTLTRKFMALSPKAFLDYLYDRLQVRLIVVGEDYRFGREAQGDVVFLKSYAMQKDLELVVLEKQKWKETEISSSRIRLELAEGELALANALLGRPYSIRGEVVHGEKRGRTLGIPTANLSSEIGYVLPKPGVYYTKLELDQTLYDALTFVGENITFGEHRLKIETYIYDFDEIIYGKMVRIFFYEYLRPNYAFASKEALIEQMRQDKEKGLFYKKIYK